jgi:hypothetical protein
MGLMARRCYVLFMWRNNKLYLARSQAFVIGGGGADRLRQKTHESVTPLSILMPISKTRI